MLKRLTLLPIGLLLGLLACQDTPPVGQEPPNVAARDTLITYLALGDSYTIGESVAVGERWPMHLWRYLVDSSVAVDSPRIIARTGWTTDELQAAMDQTTWLADTFDLVSLLIGVNNQYRSYDFARYEADFTALLQRALALAQGNPDRVFVVSIPDYGVTPFGQTRDSQKIAQELDHYNAYAFRVADSMGIAFYHITDISREALDDTTLVAPDNLHPSGTMYRRWVEEVIGPGVLGQVGE